MNKILLINLLFCFSCKSIVHANWYKLDVKGAIVPFSKIAKVGKVSVFIISTPSCAPCKVLKSNLYGDKTINMEKVDFYLVNLASGISERELIKTTEFKLWRQAEKLEGYPYVYMLSPATNIVARGTFIASDIRNSINVILETFKDFDDKTMLAKNTQVREYQEDIVLNFAEVLEKTFPDSNFNTEERNSNPSNMQEAYHSYSRLSKDRVLKVGIDMGLHGQPYNNLRVKIFSSTFDNLDIENASEGIYLTLKEGIFRTEDLEKIKSRSAALFDISLSHDCKQIAIRPKKCRIIEIETLKDYCNIKFTN